MKKARRTLAMLLTLVLVITLAACGNANSQSKAKEVYFVTCMSGGVCWQPCEDGFKKAAEELGWNAHWLSPTVDGNTAEMVTLCETALTQGADALILVALEDEPYADVLTRAKEKNIPVMTVNTTISDAYTDATVGTDSEAFGVDLADCIYEKMGTEEINLVFMQSQLTGVSQTLTYTTMIDHLKELGANVNLQIQDECKSSSATAQDKLAALKKTYPEINVIVCTDGYGTEGLGAFIQENDLADAVLSIGRDDTTPTLNYVKKGALSCVFIQNFYDMGYQSVKMCQKYLNKEEYPTYYNTGSTILTVENVEEHAAQFDITLDG